MTGLELLEPMVVRAMKARDWDRAHAERKALEWLAGELQVSADFLRLPMDSSTQFWAEAAIERQAVLAKYSKVKAVKQYHIPEAPPPRLPPNPEEWARIERELIESWGQAFFDAFFGNYTEREVKSDGLLAAGQYAPEAIRSVNQLALIDA